MTDTLEEINQTLRPEEETQKSRYLLFSLGNENYGVEIKYVMEIIRFQPITEIPESPTYFKGIINLRGKIIPVIDARIKFMKPEKEYNNRTCTVLIKLNDNVIGLIVDIVSDVISILEKDISPPPKFNININNDYIKGIGNINREVILFLDCEKFFRDNELISLLDTEHNHNFL